MLKPFIYEKTGDVYLNDDLRYAKSLALVPSQNQTPIVVPAAVSTSAPGISAPVVIEAPGDAVCEVMRFYGRHDRDVPNSSGTYPTAANNQLEVEMYDAVLRRGLSNKPVLVDHCFGQYFIPPTGSGLVAGLRPFKLCESLLMEPQGALRFTFYNPSTAANGSSFQFSLDSQALQSYIWKKPRIKDDLERKRARKKRLQPYWLTTGPVSVPASGSVLTTFLYVSKDIRVVLFNSQQRALDSNFDVIDNNTPSYTVEILDGQTQRPLQNRPVSNTVFAGSDFWYYWMGTGWMLEPSSRIQINLVNTTGVALTAYLTFHGVACYVGE